MSNKELLEYLLLGITGMGLLSMVVGMFKPWVVLWWEDIQHRKKVLIYYGTASLLFYIVYWIVAHYI